MSRESIDQSILASPVRLPLESAPTTTITDPDLSRIVNYLTDGYPDATDHSLLSTNYITDEELDEILNGLPDKYQQSTTVNPVCTIPAVEQSQIFGQELMNHQPIPQFDQSKSGPIDILSQPRPDFRPRTEKESEDSSHFIRCAKGSKHAYPTILIPKSWANRKNIVQIILLTIDGQPHPYTIDNKDRKKSSLIFKEDQANSLCFHVTSEDLQKGEKTLLIEFIKSKQDKFITKELIQVHHLNQSKLFFARHYETADGSYQLDKASRVCSSTMTENYGNFTIKDVFPLYGPMFANQKVCLVIKGRLPKDFKNNLVINITGNGIAEPQPIETIKKNGNHFTFYMPTLPNSRLNRAKVLINIEYNEEIIHQAGYKYIRAIDNELTDNESTPSALRGLSSSNNGDMVPCHSSVDTEFEGRCTKRAKH